MALAGFPVPGPENALPPPTAFLGAPKPRVSCMPGISPHQYRKLQVARDSV